MVIFTSYYNMAIDLQDDTLIIWVPCSNTIPFYFNRLNMVQPPFNNRFAPPWSIINPYKEGIISYEEFSKRYVEYLNTNFNKDEVLLWLSSLQENYPDRIIVFLCYEKEYDKCHRTILCNWLGVNAGELSSFSHI